jgi:hypothetical protein
MKVYAALNKWKRREFSYGDADCCQFAAFIVKELTGKDYSSEFSYSSEGEAEALIAQKGELVDFITGILGKPSFELKDGDPCIVNLPIVGQACGVKLSNHIVCLTEKGMVRVPNRYLIAGWSV